MDAVKVWGFSMCSAVVIGSVVSMIAPSLEKQKMMKLVISAFVLAGVISPMLNLIDEIDLSVQASGESTIETEEFEFDENLLNELENSVSQSLFPIIQIEFEKRNIDYDFGINVELKQGEDGIQVECVNITVMDLHKIEKDELKAIIEKNLGLNVNITAAKFEESNKNE